MCFAKFVYKVYSSPYLPLFCHVNCCETSLSTTFIKTTLNNFFNMGIVRNSHKNFLLKLDSFLRTPCSVEFIVHAMICVGRLWWDLYSLLLFDWRMNVLSPGSTLACVIRNCIRITFLFCHKSMDYSQKVNFFEHLMKAHHFPRYRNMYFRNWKVTYQYNS